jgi:hypothetical protein
MAGTIDQIRQDLGNYRRGLELQSPTAIHNAEPVIFEIEGKIEICDIQGAIKSLTLAQKLLN